MKYIRLCQILVLIGCGVLGARFLDFYYEKKLVLKFLKIHGISDTQVLDSSVYRGFLWIDSSNWKVQGEGGHKSTFGIHEADFDILSRLPPFFNDDVEITASWRNRLGGKDFYCVRSSKYIYLVIFHY